MGDADKWDGYDRPTNFATSAYGGSSYESGLDLNSVTTVGESRFFQSNALNKPSGIGAGHVMVLAGGDVSNRGIQLAADYTTEGRIYMRNLADKIWVTMWNSYNDGSGSGLDADMVDGLHASSFLRSNASDTASGSITFTAVNYFTGTGGINWYDSNQTALINVDPRDEGVTTTLHRWKRNTSGSYVPYSETGTTGARTILFQWKLMAFTLMARKSGTREMMVRVLDLMRTRLTGATLPLLPMRVIPTQSQT